MLDAMVFSLRTLGFVNAPALMQRVVARLQDVTVDVSEYRQKRDFIYDAMTEIGYDESLMAQAEQNWNSFMAPYYVELESWYQEAVVDQGDASIGVEAELARGQAAVTAANERTANASNIFGGVVSGATIGATVGGVPGAVIGGLLGAVAAWLASL